MAEVSVAAAPTGLRDAFTRIRVLLLVEVVFFGSCLMLALATANSERAAMEAATAVGLVGGVMLGLQILLLLPAWRPRARRSRGVPVWLSLGAGAALAAALLGGFVAAVIHAFQSGNNDAYALAGLLVAAFAWPIGTVLFVSLVGGRASGDSPEHIVAKTSRAILKGTAFEALAVLPLDAMIRRKSDCYCVAGSVLAWAVCVAVGVIVFGPAALLPALVRQRERHYAVRCDGCGALLADASRDPSTYREPGTEKCGCGEVVRAERRRAAGGA